MITTVSNAVTESKCSVQRFSKTWCHLNIKPSRTACLHCLDHTVVLVHPCINCGLTGEINPLLKFILCICIHVWSISVHDAYQIATVWQEARWRWSTPGTVCEACQLRWSGQEKARITSESAWLKPSEKKWLWDMIDSPKPIHVLYWLVWMHTTSILLAA